jgi:hypothetical protein
MPDVFVALLKSFRLPQKDKTGAAGWLSGFPFGLKWNA